MAAMTKKRIALIKRLEEIVGGSCYNPNSQNWGPNGRRLNDGRTFSYPMRYITPDDPKKNDHLFAHLTKDEQMSGYYQLGANRLPIMEVLNEVLAYLEENNGLGI